MKWITATSHTQALLGFVFYLWLGVWASRHSEAFLNWVERMPANVVFFLAVFTMMAATGESWFLAMRGSDAALNTLRISNQLYSVAAVLAILKFRKALWPRFIDVRASTYGIYLTHAIVLSLLMNAVRYKGLKMHAAGLTSGNVAAAGCFALLIFVLTYGSALVLTNWIAAQPNLSWMVSKFASARTAPAKELPLTEPESAAEAGVA
jgi:membrane-bound acyltransferase YfiQ involved in biofilm formation